MRTAPFTGFTKRSRAGLIAIVSVALLLMLLTWWQAMRLVDDGEQRARASAERDLANLTRVTQEHAFRTLRAADAVVQLVRQRYLEVGEHIDLKETTELSTVGAGIFNQVGIIDARGIYRFSNQATGSLMNLSDREHFRVHIDAQADTLYISKPVQGRITGKWSLQLTRRISLPNGQFAGVVVVSVDVDYFTRFYGELDLGHNGLAALYDFQGNALARRVGDQNRSGSLGSDAHLLQELRAGKAAGSFVRRSSIDGTERLLYFRKLPDYPLLTVAGLDMEGVLGNATRAKHALQSQAALMTLLILGLAGALAGYVYRLQGEILRRRKAQSNAQERSTQLDAIFALSPDGFISFDPDHCVRFVNPAFFRLLAQTPVRLEGLHEQEFSAWLDARCMPSLRFAGLSQMRAMPTPRTVIAIAPPPDDAADDTDIQPTPRFLQVDYSQSSSGPVSQILYFRDVTHEFEVGRMKSEFLSTAAHELRTPMASIFGFTEMLLESEFDPDSQREFLEIIYQQSKDVARILDELLDLARIESRRGMDFQRARLDLNALLQDCIKAHKPPADRERPELVLGESAAWVIADAGKLRQVVGNVLSNAYKYSPQGGAVQVRLDASPLPSPQCHIRITDHGIGLTPDQIKHVWDRFYRADTSGTIPGTGLGMTIVKEIIELHGGCVGIESTPGKGSTVTMTLPLCAPSV